MGQRCAILAARACLCGKLRLEIGPNGEAAKERP